MLSDPLAVVEAPIAVLMGPLAVVPVPRAVLRLPLAAVKWPIAVLQSPLAVVPKPKAALNGPTLTSSHLAPSAKPARNAAFPGYHIMRTPVPVAGMTPTLVVPLATKPPSARS